jgi:DNA-binding transcriptional MocR family regulator
MNRRPKALINLLRGWPSPTLLPPEALKTTAGIVLSDRSLSVPALQYGPDEGYHTLREEVARWLTQFYKRDDGIKTDRICITGGASQNLACLLQTFTDPIYTRNVWMVAPTYFLACRIFEDSGFAGRLRSVPEDEEGIDLASLSRQIAESEQRARVEGNLTPVCYPLEVQLCRPEGEMLKCVANNRR